jgi:arylsulfatase A-like enzyme
MKAFCLTFATIAAVLLVSPARSHEKHVPSSTHNVIIFVADGLRYDSVTEKNAPTLSRIRRDGVDFANSHAVYPTLTTANASAIATGHHLGDTGDYANTLFVGYPVAARLGASIVFLEDDAVLRDVKQHFAGGYLGPTTLLQTARNAHIQTAVIGKLGPAAIQDLEAFDGKSILIDDVANKPTGFDGLPSGAAAIPAELASQIADITGAGQPPPPSTPNTSQQTYLSAAAAKVVLPSFKRSGGPFALLFWSRDPDATQHQQQDQPGSLTPGINGPTSGAAIANADASLKAILDAVDALGLNETTDIFVTADHGFSTIAKSAPSESGEIPPPHLPQGFLATSVAQWLQASLFDPDAGNAPLENMEHPSRGNGLIGKDPADPIAAVAANGGSDLLWFQGPDARRNAKLVFDQLIQQNYVSGIFIDDRLMKTSDPNEFAGALPLSEIGLVGDATVPRPSIVVSFRSFAVPGCKLSALLCTAEIADTNLTVGQGMHGSFSRSDTRNFMAAIGPDFKAHFIDSTPVANVDIAPTLAKILKLSLPATGTWRGRVIAEALRGAKSPSVSHKVVRSLPGPGGVQTVLDEQIVGHTVYLDAGGFPGRTVGLGQP